MGGGKREAGQVRSHKAGPGPSSMGNTGLRLGLNPPTAAVRQDSICDCCLHLCRRAALLLEGQESDGWSRPSTCELRGHLPPWLAWQRGSGTSSVIHCDVPEEIRHGLSVVDPPNRFRQNQADVDRLDFRTLQFLDLVRHRVCHHHLVDG